MPDEPKSDYKTTLNLTDTPFPIGYFFSADERVRRLQQVLSERDKVTLDDLKRLQRDTISLESRELAAALARLIESEPNARAVAPAFLSGSNIARTETNLSP